MNFFVALAAHYQGFASSCCHLFDPYRFFSSSWLFQIGQLADMMNFYFLFRSAEFAGVRQHPLEQFAPVGHDELRESVNKDGILFPLERNPSEVRDKWLLVVSLHHDLQ